MSGAPTAAQARMPSSMRGVLGREALGVAGDGRREAGRAAAAQVDERLL